MSPTWETASDWDSNTSESGVVHESVANTDHDDAGTVKRGYSVASPSPTTGLALYWPFHEESGGTAYDFSENGYNGTVSGATTGSNGLLGTSCYSFDGGDDSVTTSNNSDLGSTPISLCVWFKTTDGTGLIAGTPGGTSNIVGDGWYVGFNLRDSSSGELTLGLRDSSGNATNLTTNSTYHDGEWHYLVATIGDPSDTSTWAIYIDGAEQGSTITRDQGATDTGNQNHDFQVGGRASESDYYLNAEMVEMRKYTTTISPTDIQSLYDVYNTNGSFTTEWRTV